MERTLFNKTVSGNFFASCFTKLLKPDRTFLHKKCGKAADADLKITTKRNINNGRKFYTALTG